MTPVTEPRIYSCREWGARPPLHDFPATTPQSVVWHHMAWPNRSLISDPQGAVERAFEIARRCQTDHMDGNGWADTDAVGAALQALPQFSQSANIFADIALLSSILAAVHQHGGG